MFKSRGERAKMERLASKEKDKIESQNVAIHVEAQMRAMREEETMAMKMTGRRNETERLERADVTRIEAERPTEVE